MEAKVREDNPPTEINWKNNCEMSRWIENRNSNCAVAAVSVWIIIAEKVKLSLCLYLTKH
jgi:hypothetical protein